MTDESTPTDAQPVRPVVTVAPRIEFRDRVLTFDPADVETIEFDVSVEPVEVTRGGVDGDGARHWVPGQRGFSLHVAFKAGAGASWADIENALSPTLSDDDAQLLRNWPSLTPEDLGRDLNGLITAYGNVRSQIVGIAQQPSRATADRWHILTRRAGALRMLATRRYGDVDATLHLARRPGKAPATRAGDVERMSAAVAELRILRDYVENEINETGHGEALSLIDGVITLLRGEAR